MRANHYPLVLTPHADLPHQRGENFLSTPTLGIGSGVALPPASLRASLIKEERTSIRPKRLAPDTGQGPGLLLFTVHHLTPTAHHFV